MDVNGEVTPSWNLTAAYTYIDGQTTKADPVDLLGRTQGVPYNRISLWSTHTLKGKLKGLKLGGGIETQSSQLDYFKNHLAGYATAEIFASYDWRIKQKNVSAQLNISNLFDQHYYASTDNIPGEPLKAIATFKVEL
jgi:iron complex outermembrane receptor protein